MREIKLKELQCTCGICPTQFEAVDTEDREYYFRYRYGCMTIHEVDNCSNEYYKERLLAVEIGGEYDGSCSWDDFVAEALKVGINFIDESDKTVDIDDDMIEYLDNKE